MVVALVAAIAVKVLLAAAAAGVVDATGECG